MRARTRAADAEAAGVAKERLLELATLESHAALDAVLGWTRLLRGSAVDRHGRDVAMAALESCVDKHLALLSDLLEVARVEHVPGQLELAFVDLPAILGRAFDAAADVLAEQDVVLVPPHAPRPFDVLADRLRIERAIAQLITEAARCSARNASLHLTFDVEDAACVVRLSTNDAVRTPALSDLDLATARNAALLHGGSLDVRSDDARAFVLELRLPHSERTDAGAVAQPLARGELEGAKVLVMHGDRDTSDLAAFLLRQRGAKILVVRDVEAAAIAHASFAPHVIVAGDAGAAARFHARVHASAAHVVVLSTAFDVHRLVRTVARYRPG